MKTIIFDVKNLNRWQRQIIEDYMDGEFSHLLTADSFDVFSWGDTLFSFLLIELSTEEGCDSLDQVELRCENAMTDIQAMLMACVKLENAIATQ